MAQPVFRRRDASAPSLPLGNVVSRSLQDVQVLKLFQHEGEHRSPSPQRPQSAVGHVRPSDADQEALHPLADERGKVPDDPLVEPPADKMVRQKDRNIVEELSRPAREDRVAPAIPIAAPAASGMIGSPTSGGASSPSAGGGPRGAGVEVDQLSPTQQQQLEIQNYSLRLIGGAGTSSSEGQYLDRDFLENAISTYNRLAEQTRNRKQYEQGIKYLRRALMLEVPPTDWPLRILVAKTQVNVATLHYLQGNYQDSLFKATLARDQVSIRFSSYHPVVRVYNPYELFKFTHNPFSSSPFLVNIEPTHSIDHTHTAAVQPHTNLNAHVRNVRG